MTSKASDGSTLTALFSLTLFLSAALMFNVQPMVGKMLLPLVGGTPAGWITAMSFFQLMLLAGYFLAHVLSKADARLHAVAYLVILIAGFLFLPVSFSSGLDQTPTPFDIFKLLGTTLAVPFIALSATSSTIQRIFASGRHQKAQDPYFLYVASNFGSFLGLFFYPLVSEPLWTLDQQAQYWRLGYGILFLFAVLCALLARKSPAVSQSVPDTKITWTRRLKWVALAFIPSSLMLGVTTHITTDVVSAPMIWVVPLAAYLLTFIMAFSPRNPVNLEKLSDLQPAIAALALAYLTFVGRVYQSWDTFFFHMAAFAVTALLCHMLLAKDRPHASNLTSFYLYISIGGALGGILNAFVAPVIFQAQIEYPLVLLAACLVNPLFASKLSRSHRDYIIGAMIGVAVVAAATLLGHAASPVTVAIGVISFILFTMHPRTLLAAGICTLAWHVYKTDINNTVIQTRNFFGITHISQQFITVNGNAEPALTLRHGTTTHGLQMTATPQAQKTPTAYYSTQGPLGDIFTAARPRHVGIIGLGTGTIACHQAKGRTFTFYEIDPAMKVAAGQHFTFLKECAPDATIIMGDGRLALSHTDERYDLLILDAFSSDMIPTHLLTTEALELYARHLKDGGAIALHLSNKYLRLQDIAAVTAAAIGMDYLFKIDDVPVDGYAFRSKWMVVTKNPAIISTLSSKEGWKKLSPKPSLKPWTDQYTNFLNLVEF